MTDAALSSDTPHSVPLVDLAPLDTPEGTEAVGRAIREAGETVGFFYIANHGVAPGTVDGALDATRAFFALPEETRLRAKINRWHRGYVPVGQTKLDDAYTPDQKESFNWGRPTPEDHPDVQAGRVLTGPNQWPDEPAALRPALEGYYAQMDALAKRLFRGVAAALSLPHNFFAEKVAQPLVSCRVLHYPPQPADRAANAFGAAPHTDYGVMTILWQDPMGGLEIKDRAGNWIAAPQIPGTFVINFGDLMQRWSNDRFVSSPHRVINASGRDRYSIACFYNPSYDETIACLPGCADASGGGHYEPTTVGAFMTEKFDRNYAYRKKAG